MLVALREPSVPDFIQAPGITAESWLSVEPKASLLPSASSPVIGKKTRPLSVTHQEPADEMSVVCHANAQAES